MAIAALVLVVFPLARWLGFALVCLTLVVTWVNDRRASLGSDRAARTLLAASAVVLAAQEASGAQWPRAVGGALLVAIVLHEEVLHRAAMSWYVVANLRSLPRRPATLAENGIVWLVNSILIALVGLLSLLSWPAWSLLVLMLVAASLSAAELIAGWRRWRTGHDAELAALKRALERHEPRFMLYFSAPPGSGYQAGMWLPYLAEIGEPFVVVLPEEHNLPVVSSATTAPVIAYRSFEALDAVIVPSLRAAFYVNNGMKNAHCVRFAHLTHVQLYHGDSDKAVTASPLNAMFDRIFVAGQAAVDRFAAHGVSIPREKIRIVGRPQVAQVEVADEHISQVADKIVLYAPTWAGAHADSNYCSLPIAETIIQHLLDREATIVVRAHPYTERDRRSATHLRRVAQMLERDQARTGRAHRWGRAASARLSLFDCMNLSHAMICDVSSVASEYLYSGKPFAITDMVGAGSGFSRSFPLANAAYILDHDAGNLATVLDDLLVRDPLAQSRREMRAYYLGDFPTGRYGEAFLAEARALVTGPAPAARAADAGPPVGERV